MQVDEFHDPFTFNLRRQTQILLSKIPSDIVSNSTSTSQLLDNLSSALAIPAYTICIATLFRPILLDLCARWITNSQDLEKEFIALCLLIEVHEELYPILYRMLQDPIFAQGPIQPILASSRPDVKRVHQSLLAYYRILQANRELPYQFYWPLTPLRQIASDSCFDPASRLLAIKCYALQSGMVEAEREKWETATLDELYTVDCPLGYGDDLDGSQVTIDGWLMPSVELERVRSARNAIMTEVQGFYCFDTEPVQQIYSSDLCPLVVNLHGVLMLRYSVPENISSSLIHTPTAAKALRSLALHLTTRLPVLITSSPSSGKTLLLSHLAETLFPHVRNQLVFIHLADTSLDPRSLLGSHVSSRTQPGTFEWKEGILVRAMREGKWVVFKDIDRGSNEVLALIKPLIETLSLDKWIGGCASLEVVGRGKVVAADTFAIFATRSVPPSRKGMFPTPTFYGAHKLHEVVVASPSAEELITILTSRFPHLNNLVATGMICLWEAVRELGTTASTRDVGIRELEKFCVRVEQLVISHQATANPEPDEENSLSSIFPSTSLREEIFLAARDVLFGFGTVNASARTHIESISRTVGIQLGLEPERQEWLLTRWVPNFDVETDKNGRSTAVCVGRTRLLAKSSKREIMSYAPRPFAMHRPAILLMSRIASAIALTEPVLLTGETGTGKTSVITQLAHILHQPLISLNLSNQTESSDLIGGFRPLDARVPALSLQSNFLELFGETFSRKKNEKFETDVRKSITQGNWKRAVGLWKESLKLAKNRILKKQSDELEELDSQTPRKRRKVDYPSLDVLKTKWSAFERDVEEFSVQYVSGKGRLAFGFVEGPLVQALREGNWILLDEINLASAETLECVAGILRSPTASITLTEQGSLEPVPRHPNFRLFACMNPATDVGKKDLPPNVRSRFTEIGVPPPDADRETLLTIVTQYIGPSAVSDKASIMDISDFYLAVKELAETRQIADGANHRPHFSMRTLSRALTFASDIASTYGLRRALWEGCLMAFTMVLDTPSAKKVIALAQKHLLAGVKNVRSTLAKEPTLPSSRAQEECVKLGPFYLERGPLPVDPADDYILTPSVEKKLIDLARIILTRRFPVLIEGPTSSGKTSSIEYLAKRTGHRFVRINNHEHTDIQEYIGSYVPHPVTGRLIYTDGLLVRALRNGDWIVLDELNLAPTDVLEALNRLLDDNRELVIPETGEIVRPHPHFVLFATQNPSGLYAGRKILSRAFRNRFLEVHFEDVPEAELEVILCQRCMIAPSHGKKIVAVFRELQKRRQSDRVFESKQGFATLRDLFRWAGRDAVGYQELGENGYMLLAERARREEDKIVVKEIIESIMGVKIDEKTLYDFKSRGMESTQFLGCDPSDSSLIWTKAMQRLFVLVARALRFNEPVLLVGETGSGKTSVCQVYADVTFRKLHGINCHQNTETADLIGGLRPIRNRGLLEVEALQQASVLSSEFGLELETRDVKNLESQLDVLLKSTTLSSATRVVLEDLQNKILGSKAIFEWHDGPLIDAMRNGDVFLLDEISLADDSVLERLNSVLEPSRTLVLAEKAADDYYPILVAQESFKLVATMNPGGDYGKKELSPALRNRFTEIWVPPIDDRKDLDMIINCSWKHEGLQRYTTPILDFVEWLSREAGDSSLLNLRDILAWVSFSNVMCEADRLERMPTEEIFHHAAHMTYLDGLGSIPSLSSLSDKSLQNMKLAAVARLNEIVPCPCLDSFTPIHDPSTSYRLGAFVIRRGSMAVQQNSFTFQAPTTHANAMRVVRACQLAKPILLEGSPGVGKTSLVTALAQVSGHKLCRINLSDQTDLIDLFGSDLPVDGGEAGEFAWKDGEFLRALQEGCWVLLDEMNLAPQSVLEGLNAVLDHRGSVYIPELGRTFTKHPAFRIFAAQNPLTQGGGRKGLPKSFVNRFTKVYVDQLLPSDLRLICQQLHPEIDVEELDAMINFNGSLHDMISIEHALGKDGAPWEFNLRDILRWIDLLKRPSGLHLHPADHVRSVYLHRFRTTNDRHSAEALFKRTFNGSFDCFHNPVWTISPSTISVGQFRSRRQNFSISARPRRLLKSQLTALEAIGCSISHSTLAIVTGSRDTGKTAVIEMLAQMTGNVLQEVHVNSSTDTMDLLGGFEQVDWQTRFREATFSVIAVIEEQLRNQLASHIDIGAYLSLRRAVTKTSLENPEIILELMSRLFNGSVSATVLSQISLAQTRMKEVSMSAQNGSAGRFEWIDGPLVRALEAGHWLLLDGANLCNPSVLDRLNSLCEVDGSLTLSEKGFVDGKIQILKPHPNFRLFMTVDPQYGELSRAMRNRGVEIALISSLSIDDGNLLHDHHRLPTLSGNITSPTFAALRLGISEVEFQPSPVSRIPSGHVLDQESTLNHLLDVAPSFSGTSGNEDALYHFASRCITPKAILMLHRFFQSKLSDNDFNLHDFNLTCRKILSSASTALSRLRDRYSTQEMLDVSHVLAMPTDFFLGFQFSISDPAFGHQTTFNILRLAVGLVQSEASKLALNPGFPSSGDKRTERTVAAIDNLMREIHGAGALTLEMSSNVPDTQALSLVCEIMEHMHHLKENIPRRVLDYSALQPLAEQVVAVSEKLPAAFSSLKGRSKDLKEATMLFSGLGINQIWSMFRDLRFATSDVLRLEEYSMQIDGPPDLRRQVLNLMTMASVFPTTQHEVVYRRITEVLQHRIRSRKNGQPDNEFSAVKVLHLSTRLTVMSMLTLSKTARRVLANLITHACNKPFARLGHLWPYQQSLWVDDALQDSAESRYPQKTSLLATWLYDIWGLEDEGPAVLFRPVQLQSVLSVWDWNTTPMAKLGEYETILYSQAQLALLNTEQVLSRHEQLAIMLKQSILKIASCFIVADNPSHKGALPVAFGQGADSPVMILPELEDAFNHSVAFKRAVATHLHPVFATSETPNESYTEYIARLGLCWISTGKLFLDLFIPDVPIDPAAVESHIFEFWSKRAASISKELALHSELEKLMTGNIDNEVTTYLRTFSIAAEGKFANGPPSISSRDVTRLHMFWSEVLQFQEHVLNPTKVNDLISDLKAGDTSSFLREQVIQKTIIGFTQRMQSAYADFGDIVFPIHYAILHLQMGLRVLKQSSVFDHADNSTATALAGFPTIRSAETYVALQKDGHVQSELRAFQRLVITMAAISLERSVGVEIKTHISLLNNTYEQASRLWQIDRKKEEEQQKTSESLYRQNHTAHSMESDAELEEREFAHLFPSFESVLSGDEPSSSGGLAISPPTYQISDSAIKHFVSLHNVVFSGEGFTVSSYRSVQLSALPGLLAGGSLFLDTLDYDALPLCISLLAERLEETRASSNPQRLYNFYADANIQETRKALECVTQTKERLHTLIDAWPDQMVLRHLEERCDVILALNLDSPVAKILSALEQLLLHTEDWEVYANKENSLRHARSNIIELIVGWRRLELNSWQVLLETEMKKFEDDVLPWWFRLYDVIIRGPLDILQRNSADSTTEISTYLEDVIPLLDDFIRGSPIGQFRTRLRMLRSFGNLCHQLQGIHDGQSYEILERIRRIVNATVGYFITFSSSVDAELTAGRETLEAEVRDLIKLASWKDVNVHALKQSAQRTHRQLYKVIRRYRELLRQPVSGRLEMLSRTLKGENTNLDTRTSDIVNPPNPTFTNTVSDMSAPVHLIHLGRTYLRFEQLVTKSIAPWIASRSADAVETFAIDIIVTSKELSSISIPSSLAAERREKQQKALLTRKRKAWTDLLKELKRAGFAAHVKPDVLLQNRSTRWIREQPSLVGTSEFEFEKSELYWNRLNGLFPLLRANIPSHHADLSTRELQRGVNFLESSFSMATESRARLSGSFSSYTQLQHHLRRVRGLASSCSVVYSAGGTSERLVAILSVLRRMECALNELCHAFNSFLHLDAPLADPVMNKIENILSSCVDQRTRFQGLVDTVQLTSFPVILTEEYVLILETTEFLQAVIQTMSLCVDEENRLRPYIHPILDWLRSVNVDHSFVSKPEPNPAIACNGDEIINMCLGTVEILLAKSSNHPSSEPEENRDYYIREDCQVVHDSTNSFKVDQVIQLLNHSLRGFAAGSTLDVDRYLPFLELYNNLLHIQLDSHSRWTKSLLKLNYVVCSVLDTLCQQGFCKPPEPDEEGTASGDGAAEVNDGVGMGEGSGANNVSKEIEEESQVEGLQGDKDENESRENQDDDAIEMSQDFDGDMEDVPDNGSQAEEESDSESNPDPEEQVHDLDAADPAAVDEKFWGNEKGPEGGEDKANKDSSTQESGESEVVAKEGNNKTDKTDDAKDEDTAESNDKAAEPQTDVGEEEEEVGEDSNHPDASGAPMDEHVPEADALELPENMDMGMEDDTEGMDLDKMDADEEEIEDTVMEEPIPQGGDDQQGHDRESPSPTGQDDGQELEGKDATEAETEQKEDGHEVEDSAVAKPDIGQGEGGVDGEPNFEQSQDQSHAESGTSMGMSGKAATAKEKSQNDSSTDPPEAREKGEEFSMDLDSTSEAAPIGSEQGQQPSRQTDQLSFNPLRSLADALQEVQRRFDEILDSGGQDMPKDQVGASETPAALEYLRPDDTDYDMQALGPAHEERAAKLHELSLVDDEMDPNSEAPFPPDMAIPTEAKIQEHQRPPPKQPEFSSNESPREAGLEGALAQNGRQPSFEEGALANREGPNVDVDMEDAEALDVELELRSWQASGHPDDQADHIWRLYETLTHELAYSLCEQLRLILEPTLATRLKGDYRTGKRLNMKKIIPYIASDYTKDKIWLRRTRPSQREYQVLIALDDSRSMAESHSVHLAYQTLALVSKALTRLEAGDIGIASFGQDVQMLHDFDGAPFSDQAGIEVIKAFHFDQKATNVLSLVDTSLRVLEAARERRSVTSSTAADLWQLEIIISDGMCQDHDKLRAVLRKAEEQRVMIVFIILDSLHTSKPGSSAQGSILSMEKAEFKNVDGKMELQLQRYLDSFPFEYYVVLRDVEALPQVLSATLKQFFERISEE